MDNEQCLICRSSFFEFKTEDVTHRIVRNKILFDSCVSLFKIKEKSYKTDYKWSYNSQLDVPNFCNICAERIVKLAELEKNICLLKNNTKDTSIQIQNIITTSTPPDGLGMQSYFPEKDPDKFLKSGFDKISFLRNIALQDFSTGISLPRSKEKDIDEIIDLQVECQPLTKSEMDHFFLEVGDKFQCKLCSSFLKEKRNLNRHVNKRHRNIMRFQCKYCEMTFYEKSECRIHLNKNHQKSKVPPADGLTSVSNSPDSNSRCFLCYRSLGDELAPIPPETLSSFIFSLVDLNRCPSSENITKILTDSVLSCSSCLSNLTELHNQKLESEKVGKIFDDLLLQLKTSILLSISKTQIVQEEPYTAGKMSSADKIKYFAKLAVKDFFPDIYLFKTGVYTIPACHYKPKGKMQRSSHENSIFKLVKDEEIINLKSNSEVHTVPLTDEELQYYFERIGEKFSCKQCSCVRSSYWGAVNHCNKQHKNIKRFQCRYCAEPFYNRHECARHVLTSHKIARVNISAEIETTLKQKDSIATTDGVISLQEKSNLRLSKNDIIKLSDNSYKCAICSKEYKNRNATLHHQKKIHLASHRYKCEFCNFKNHHKHPVLYHIRIVHPDKQKQIDEKSGNEKTQVPPCLVKRISKTKKEKVLDPSYSLGMKVLEVKAVPKIEDHFTVIGSQYSCTKCGREFTSRYNIMDHIKRIHFGVRRYQCGVCIKKFYSLCSCKRHMKIKHPVYYASLATSSHKELGGIKSSMLSNHIEVDDSAGDIFNEFSSNVDIEDVKYQDNEEILSDIPLQVKVEMGQDSPDVDIDFEGPFIYKTEDEHEITMENNEPEEIDEFIENESATLNKSSGVTKPIVGLDSSRDAPSRACLLYELIKPGEIIKMPKSPNYEKDREEGCKRVSGGFKCEKCGRQFKRWTIFMQHWGNVHDTSGGYQCSICQKRYYAKFPCVEHYIYKHTNSSPFVCHLCDSVCISKLSLQAHIKTHIDERQFLCSMCPLKFISQKKLDSHYENVHMKILGK